jgi:hypothetical protein
MMEKAVLIEKSDGSSVLTRSGQELGRVCPVHHGKNRGQWRWESFMALASHREGHAPSKQGALYNLGFRMVANGPGGSEAICFEREDDAKG